MNNYDYEQNDREEDYGLDDSDEFHQEWLQRELDKIPKSDFKMTLLEVIALYQEDTENELR